MPDKCIGKRENMLFMSEDILPPQLLNKLTYEVRIL